jgi:AmiR/NasT family two-component response regulator
MMVCLAIAWACAVTPEYALERSGERIVITVSGPKVISVSADLTEVVPTMFQVSSDIVVLTMDSLRIAKIVPRAERSWPIVHSIGE